MQMKEFIDVIIDKYPWLAFSIVWIIWVIGTLVEYKFHKNKKVTCGWLVFLSSILIFAVTQVDIIIYFRIILSVSVILVTWVVIRYVIKDDIQK
jgi:hypothetical protein